MEIDTIRSNNPCYLDNRCQLKKILFNPIQMSHITNDFEAFYLQSKLQSENINQHFMKDIIPTPISHFGMIPHDFSDNAVQKTLPIPHAMDIVKHDLNQPIKTAHDFVNVLWPYAKQASAILGVESRLLIAQAALETGWGKYIAHDTKGNSSYNLFNIKAPRHSEQAITVNTTEFVDSRPIKTTASFKQYASFAESFQDYVTFIQDNPRYQSALSNAQEPEKYAQALQDAGYATDPDYASKWLRIYETLKL